MRSPAQALLPGLALLAGMAFVAAPNAARASVRFEDWRSTSLDELADRAARPPCNVYDGQAAHVRTELAALGAPGRR